MPTKIKSNTIGLILFLSGWVATSGQTVCTEAFSNASSSRLASMHPAESALIPSPSTQLALLSSLVTGE